MEMTVREVCAEPRFCIGQQFYTRGRVPHLCTVTDIYTTRNAAGDLVKISYVATHQLAGQIVTDYDVPEATIARGLAGDHTEKEKRA